MKNNKIIDEQMATFGVIWLAQDEGCEELIKDEKELEQIEDKAGGFNECYDEAIKMVEQMENAAYEYLENKGYIFTYLEEV